MCLGAIEKNTGSGWVEDKRLVEEVYGFLVATCIDERYRPWLLRSAINLFFSEFAIANASR